MPTYNGEKFLADSIESILAQTYHNWELVISDDCSSSQATIDILKKYSEKDKRIRVFYLKENKGAGFARNNSIKEARGKYIAFCDSDDRWFPEKLEKQVTFMKENDIALCCASYITCNEENENKGIFLCPKRISYEMMKRDDKIGCLTAIYDSEKLGGKLYMPLIRKRQDWAYFILVTQKARLAFGIEEPLAYYRLRNNSISSNKMSLIRYNINVYRKILGFSDIKAYAFFFFQFLPNYFIKKWKMRKDSKDFMEGKLKYKNPQQ